MVFCLTRFLPMTKTEQLNKIHGFLPKLTFALVPPPTANRNCVWQPPHRHRCAQRPIRGPQRCQARGKGETRHPAPLPRKQRSGHPEQPVGWVPPHRTPTSSLSRGGPDSPFVLPPQSPAGVKVETQRKFNGIRIQLLRKDRLPLSP